MRYQDDRKYQDQQYRELYATYREEHQELNDCRKENRALADTATMVMRRVQSTLQELKKR
ncbi:MAG: hypothetical protein EOO48_14420 [Flavobacterium sp.]|nr:MAG: hypothetical protein EOO48_14420 [Flavobacterium sp.]